MVQINKLRGKMVECGLTIEKTAEAIGMNRATLYRRMSDGGDSFTVGEVELLAKVLMMSGDEINTIFFEDVVS